MAERVDVSLVMATCDKRDYLALTLESLLAQTYRRFEVVLCDDGTAGGVEDVVAPFRDRLDLTVVVQENRGRAAARNAALARVSGDLVVFIDDDRMAAPEFVAGHVAAAGGGGVIGWKRRALTFWRPGVLPLSRDDLMRLVMRVGGRDRLAEPIRLLEAGALEADPHQALASADLGDERDNHGAIIEAFGPALTGFRFDWALATTANLAVPREAVEKIGGFDESFTGWGLEDTDLSYRLGRLGVRFSLTAEAVNYHQIHPLADPDPAVAQRLMHAQLLRNLDRFCARHRSLDAYLYRRRWEHAMTLAEADRLLKRVEAEPDPLLRRELEALYADR
ncbi:glycosyltransferase [Glycomyces sp. TRM65418]|uniref:glycosyltransferase family 2 protein n=1 Tax=Glycomyces sp. TRM65418 TaxID=2867006 RepID=UPI001CE654F7|nr:glycosyltransferase [Glycomyces sp. TRM65418]MCC3765623.1 glycosyltransferase [Glycomyces sp. TRM65418]QZD55222.1 glycosyltransferase [Glycomyces sp. TRM65418]